ncbi:MAG: helix-turn-helix domain-containing protein [Pseudomonadota bacterium]
MKQILSLPEQLGPLLRAARKSAGLSQGELAKRVGVGQSRLSAMELDPGSIRVDQMLALLSVLHLECQVQSRAPADPSSAPRNPVEW